MPLTRRQQEIFLFIKNQIDRFGYAPTIQEIGKEFGLSSPATVHKHLTFLEAKGFIRRQEHTRRAIELVSDPQTVPMREFPVLGRIAAGRPIEAVEARETISILPRDMGDNVFALKVQGDSMIEDHIQDGDYVLVEQRDHAENGETVVALLDNENATLKKFYREKNRIRLQPANARMQPIYVQDSDFKIQGVVIGVIRKFK